MLRTLIVCLCVCAQAAGQSPPPVPPPLDDVPFFPTRNPGFDIPFQLGESIPGQEPVEVQLHVSDDRGVTWKLASKVDPKAGRFSYRAPHDGEFWFLVRTLNRQGRLLPEKPFAPEIRVLVDTEPPRLEVSCNRGSAGEIYCVWKSSDPQLRSDTLELKYQGIDGGTQWQPVAVAPSTPDADGAWSGRTTFVPTGVKWPLFVRVEVSDQAGNRATAQVQIAAAAGAGPQSLPLASSLGGAVTPFTPSPSAPPPGPNEGWQSSTPNPSSVAPPPMSASFPGRITTPPPQSEAIPKTSTGRPLAAAPSGESLPKPPGGEAVPSPLAADPNSPYRRTSEPRTGAPEIDAPETVAPGTPEVLPTPNTPPTPHAPVADTGPSFGGPTGDRFSDAPAPYETSKPSIGSTTPEPNLGDETPPPGVNPRMVNSRRFELEYDVEATGSSSIAQVELWATRDAGRTWSLLGRDPDQQSPYVVHVDDEGIYGFRMVIETANGLRSPTPESGDLPEVWVGVDVTKPSARIVSVQQRGDEQGPTLDIRWEADDRLLTSRPITLSFAEQPDGPWTTIASGLPNTHAYDWRFDVRTPERIYVKLDVRDVAGNAASFVTPEPAVIERVRPQGRIRGVRPIGESARLRVPSQILPR